jgi:glycosyltransferase involved in cell wall biosynthesis
MVSFSVILPNYNHAQYLVERIESILSQSYPHFEIIILDDASTDNSRAIIEQYRQHPKVKAIVYNETNTGLQTIQWLKGIELASFDHIWIAESDDIAEDNFLAIAANKLEKQTAPALFYSDSYRMKKTERDKSQQRYSAIKNGFFNTDRWQHDYQSSGEEETDGYMKYVCTINNVSCCIVPKNEALEILRQFSHMRFYNDWLFYIKLTEQCNVLYAADALNWYRSHTSSHFGAAGNDLVKKKECFNVLCYLYKAPYITSKRKLVKFFTEQYLGFGLWQERKFIPSLFSHFIKKQPGIFLQFFFHLLFIKIIRKKIKYIF